MVYFSLLTAQQMVKSSFRTGLDDFIRGHGFQHVLRDLPVRRTVPAMPRNRQSRRECRGGRGSVRKGRWLEGLGKLLSLRFNLLRSRPIQELRGILRKLVAEHRQLPARLRKLRLSGLRSLRKLLLIRHLCLSELLQLRVRGRKSCLRAAHLPAKVLHQTRSTLLIKLPIPLRSLALRGNLGSRNTLTRSRSGRSRVTLTRSRSVRNTRIGDTRHLFLLGIAAQHLPHR